jgi:hypothetical protein
MELQKCLHCNAAIRWAVTLRSVQAGGELKHMPINPAPDPSGNVEFTEPDREDGPVRVLTKEAMAGPATRYRYTAHFATCLYARRSARGATPAARERTQQRFEKETSHMERGRRDD